MEEWVSHVPSSEESACVLYLSADFEMTSFPRLCLEARHTHLPADVLLDCIISLLQVLILDQHLEHLACP